jgi:hypothetical protein
MDTLRLIALAALASLALPAHAGFIYNITGTVTKASDLPAGFEPLSVGEIFHATFEYEPPTNTGPDAGGSLGIAIQFSNSSLTGRGGAAPRRPGDRLRFGGIVYGHGLLEGFTSTDFSLFPLTDVGYPQMLLPEALQGVTFGITPLFGTVDGQRVGAALGLRIDTVAMQVPEPATLSLLSLGIFGIALARRRRRVADARSSEVVVRSGHLATC